MGTDSPSLNLDDLAERIAERIAERLRVDRDRLLNRDELADRLRISPSGVSALVARKALPAALAVGGKRCWDWATVKKFLAGQPVRKRKRRGS